MTLLLVTNASALTVIAAICVRISSGCRAGAWPASGEIRQPGAVALQTARDCDCSTRGKAAREREDFAARSVQRTKMRRVGRCRVTAARYLVVNMQGTLASRQKNWSR